MKLKAANTSSWVLFHTFVNSLHKALHLVNQAVFLQLPMTHPNIFTFNPINNSIGNCRSRYLLRERNFVILGFVPSSYSEVCTMELVESLYRAVC